MRKKYNHEFKAKVAFEACKEELTISELASLYDVHPNVIRKWKAEFLERLPELFIDKRTKQYKEENKDDVEELYKVVGQLKVENDWLKKKYEQHLRVKKKQ